MAAVSIKRKYEDILAEIKPAAIKSRSEHKRLMAETDKLMQKGDSLSAAEEKALELLAVLIDSYERETFDTGSSTPLSMLQHLMDSNDHTPRDLWQVFGDKSSTSRILSGERQMSKAQIKRLSKFYNAPASLFL